MVNLCHREIFKSSLLLGLIVCASALSPEQRYLCSCTPDGLSNGHNALEGCTIEHNEGSGEHCIEIKDVRDGGEYTFAGCGAHTFFAEETYGQYGGYEFPLCYTIGGELCTAVETDTKWSVTAFRWGTRWRKGCTGDYDCGASHAQVSSGTQLRSVTIPDFNDEGHFQDWTDCCRMCRESNSCKEWDFDVTTNECRLFSAVLATNNNAGSFFFHGSMGYQNKPLSGCEREYGTCDDGMNVYSATLAGIIMLALANFLMVCWHLRVAVALAHYAQGKFMLHASSDLLILPTIQGTREVGGGKNQPSKTQHFTTHHAEVRFLNEITSEYELFQISRENTPYDEEKAYNFFWVDKSTGKKVCSPEEKLKTLIRGQCPFEWGCGLILTWPLSLGGIISSLFVTSWVIGGRDAARFQTKYEYFTGVFANSSSIGLWVFLMVWALATALHTLTRGWKYCECTWWLPCDWLNGYRPGKEAVAYARVMEMAPLPRSSAHAQDIPPSLHWVRFCVVETRRSSDVVQLQQLALLDSAGKLLLPNRVMNPGGNSPAHEGPENAASGDETKWLDRNRHPLMFFFDSPVKPVAYYWVTANDCATRDAVKWKLEGCCDKSRPNKWVTLHDASAESQDVPSFRHTAVETLNLLSGDGASGGDGNSRRGGGDAAAAAAAEDDMEMAPKEWHGYSLLQSKLGTYLAMNFEGSGDMLPVRAMELDPDAIPVIGMLWKLNDDGSIQNKATGLVLQIRDKKHERKEEVLCAQKIGGGEGVKSQRWKLGDNHELINEGDGFLLTIRDGSKASRAQVWCNFKRPLFGATDAQKWYFRRYEGEAKAPLYPVNDKWGHYRGQAASLQHAVQIAPADKIITLKVVGKDLTERAWKSHAIRDLKMVLGHRCGIPDHELPFCDEFLAVWFCGYRLDDSRTIGECGELCDDSQISLEGVEQALNAIKAREAKEAAAAAAAGEYDQMAHGFDGSWGEVNLNSSIPDSIDTEKQLAVWIRSQIPDAIGFTCHRNFEQRKARCRFATAFRSYGGQGSSWRLFIYKDQKSKAPLYAVQDFHLGSKM